MRAQVSVLPSARRLKAFCKSTIEFEIAAILGHWAQVRVATARP
jgi:hypothetical protein